MLLGINECEKYQKSASKKIPFYFYIEHNKEHNAELDKAAELMFFLVQAVDLDITRADQVKSHPFFGAIEYDTSAF